MALRILDWSVSNQCGLACRRPTSFAGPKTEIMYCAADTHGHRLTNSKLSVTETGARMGGIEQVLLDVPADEKPDLCLTPSLARIIN